MMRHDLEIAKRVTKSYQMMLNFYGMKLVNKFTGQIVRSEDWQDRYQNLKTHFHNFLRITRILVSLGHLGFSRYKQPFLDFLQNEIFNTKELEICEEAFLTFWSKTTIYDDAYFEKTKELAEDREESVFFRN